MARRRMLEVSIAYDEHLNSISEFAELMFYRILPHTDDFGRFNGNPNIIKARTMPMRDGRNSEDIFKAVCELLTIGLLRVYLNQEKTVLQFNDEAFKRINAVLVKNNKGSSEYPEPEKWLEIDEYIKHVKVTCLARAIVSKKYKVEGKKQKVESKKEKKHPDEIKDQKHEWFETLWKTFTNEFGDKGSKKEAQEQFIKLNPLPELFDHILLSLKNQIENKKQLLVADQFVPNFPHVVRWLKRKRWEDEIIPVSNIARDSNSKNKSEFQKKIVNSTYKPAQFDKGPILCDCGCGKAATMKVGDHPLRQYSVASHECFNKRIKPAQEESFEAIGVALKTIEEEKIAV